MATFNEFRNSFPESSNEKGERFEIFLSEWMFKHHPALSSQFKKVWRFSEWPGAWSQKDLGTDLIAEDQHGKICAIQAKFYKEKNSIPKSHVDSFLSDSNREGIDYRLLIATTDNLGPNARKTIEGQEKEVQTFLLHHFLEPFLHRALKRLFELFLLSFGKIFPFSTICKRRPLFHIVNFFIGRLLRFVGVFWATVRIQVVQVNHISVVILDIVHEIFVANILFHHNSQILEVFDDFNQVEFTL